jgi:uncharacterized protein (TIGR03435 family)
MPILRLALLVTAAQLLNAASFEVATVKPASPDWGEISGEDGRDGLLKVYNVSLKRCIRYAYGIPETLIFGGPKWVDTLRFDIVARADQPVSEAEMVRMLQPLLADRFRLVLHEEPRTMPGYALVEAKGGIKAEVADPGRRSAGDGGRGRLDVVANTVSGLASRLSMVLGRPVMDKTSDDRRFNFHLRWVPDDAQPGTADGPSIFTALEEQTGLRLVSQRVSVRVLVIEGAELPSGN